MNAIQHRPTRTGIARTDLILKSGTIPAGTPVEIRDATADSIKPRFEVVAPSIGRRTRPLTESQIQLAIEVDANDADKLLTGFEKAMRELDIARRMHNAGYNSDAQLEAAQADYNAKRAELLELLAGATR